MGCISTKTDINDIHPNIFQVMNVDDLGNRMYPGQLEITETDLVLHQRRKAPIKWPLRCLRRYGFDAELFSFESGRRCPSGPGIYAFKCQRAEQLFNVLQSHIQVRNNMGEDGVSRDFPVLSASGPSISLRGSSSGDSNYLDPTPVRMCYPISGNVRFTSQNGVISTRLDSVGSSSNGPLSPQGTVSPSPPPVPVTNMSAVLSSVSSSSPSVHYANEELFSTSTSATDPSENTNRELLRQSLPSSVTMNSLSNENSAQGYPVSRLSFYSGDSGAAVQGALADSAKASYVNVDLNMCPVSPSYSVEDDASGIGADAQPVYMNVIPGLENGRPTVINTVLPLKVKSPITPCGMLRSPKLWETEEMKQCYANLQPGEMDVLCNVPPKSLAGTERMYSSVTSSSSNQSVQLVVSPVNMQRQVNYIVLDLEKKVDVSLNVLSQHPQPSSPVGSISPSVLPRVVDGPNRIPEGYATIDFNKTVALSHSVNPSADNDSEGSRKTRHNSTINELHSPPVRNSTSD